MIRAARLRPIPGSRRRPNEPRKVLGRHQADTQTHDRALPFHFRDIREVDPDELGGPATNIGDQQSPGVRRHQRRTTDHCKPRLFFRLDDFQRQTGFTSNPGDEVRRVGGPPAGLCCDKTHTPDIAVSEFFLADAKRVNRPRHGTCGQPATSFQSCTEVNGLGKAVNHMKLVPLRLGHQHAA